MALVDLNYRSQRRTAFYARHMAMSPKRLNRLCREEWGVGKNCFEVVMGRLLSEAEFLLLSSDMEVKAIGYELGFVTPQNFIMYFIRWRGMTPLAFREKGRGK
ncbi:helix-turn-helix domain-containing protein [Pedobacter chitinilyticus]